MKFAVISDIHGNIVALRAALAEIEREDVDKLLVLGDLFGPRHVHDIIDELRACHAMIIRGNGEGYYLNNRAGRYGDEWQRYDQFAALQLVYEQLTPADFCWLEALPCQVSLRYKNVSLLMTHGSPKADNDNLSRNRPAALRRALRMSNETVILCGHSHRPMLHQKRGRYICNVGSVGDNFDPGFTADVTFITCEHDEIAFEQRRVPYDHETWKQQAGDLIYTKVCLRGRELGRNLWVEFLEEAKKRGGWPVPNKLWQGLYEEWQERGIL